MKMLSLAVRAALVLALAACGGGVGTGGTGSFAAGPITGFGSVIVNAVRFDDSAAVVEDGDGNRRSRDDLKLGMTVEIDSGPVASDSAGNAVASASRIRYDSDLRGPVASVDRAGATFSVLGQQVLVDTTTVFAESLGGLAALAPGVAVEVYGVYDVATQRYRAKRVGAAATGDVPQLRAPVAQVDAAAQTLRIGSASYAYSGASATPAGLAAGQFVRLRVAAAAQSSGRWTVLSFGTALPGLADADGASLKGLISAFASATSFSVNGRPVDASRASFPDGSAALAPGVRVEVDGNLRNGTLQATRVHVETDSEDSGRDFEVHGAIESASPLQQTFVVRGLTVSTARTDLRVDNGTVAALLPGRRVEVKGRLSADRLRIDATRITFE